MRILIDIGHPGHVHLFKNFYFEFLNKDHSIHITVKNNLRSAKELLTSYEIPFISIGEKADNLLFKAINQIAYDLRIVRLVKAYRISLGIGTSISLAHASKISPMESIVFDDDDDEVQPLFTKFAHPFCDNLLSPDALKGHRKKKGTIFFSGYHELAYLHPNRFQPDKNILMEAGLTENEKYFVLRFNSFKAHHDVGVKGLSIESKRKLIAVLEKCGKIFITTEADIDPEFEKYKIKIPSHKIHSFLYYAYMFLGDSQTMTTEAAILGTPALKCNDFAGKLSVPNELENKYGLCYSYLPQDFNLMLNKFQELQANPNLKEEWQKRREKMLADKIDVTAFMVWFIENYPASIRIMRENPDYQYNFR